MGFGEDAKKWAKSIGQFRHPTLKEPVVHIITRAKKNYVAYFQADPSNYLGIGHTCKYGEKIHIMEVFDHLHFFEQASVRIYGKLEEVSLLQLDLMWEPIGGLISFIFAKTSHGPIVLMCSSLNQDPVAAIELYCLRTRIETMFDMLKNTLHVFQCHFWSKKMPKHSRKPKSNSNLQSTHPGDLITVQACWDATERFVNLGAIALGLLQLIALKFPNEIWNKFDAFLRTRSRYIPSERTTKMVMAHLLVRDFLSLAPTATMRAIRAKILKEKIEQKIEQKIDQQLEQYQEKEIA